jgi:predicted CopG family antitoxin
MASKTITLKVEAYNRLKAARRYPTESFSEVVLRATWPADTITGRELLELYRSGKRPKLSEEALDELAAINAADRPPEDPWAKR